MHRRAAYARRARAARRHEKRNLSIVRARLAGGARGAPRLAAAPRIAPSRSRSSMYRVRMTVPTTIITFPAAGGGGRMDEEAAERDNPRGERLPLFGRF